MLRRGVIGLLATGAVVGLAACGGGDDGGGAKADTSPIKIGNISALSGGIVLPYGVDGAKAYFDALNANGGIDGRKVEFLVADDKGNPTTGSQLARKLIQQDEVVALAGGQSLIDCTVNGKLYEQTGIADIVAGGAEPKCFDNPMIAPVNTGVLTGITAGMYFLDKHLGKTPTCGIFNNIPTLNDAYPGAVKRYEELTGNKPAFTSAAGGPNANVTTLMLQVKKAGCKSLVATPSGPQGPAIIKAARQVKWDGPVMLGGSSYEEGTPKAVGAAGEGAYAPSELFPFTSDSAVLDPVRKDLDAAGVKLTGITVAGWLAAKIVADTIKGIDGPVTRESVLEAFQALDSYDTEGLTAEPFAFGKADGHNPNQSIWPVVIKDGKWDASGQEWVTLPAEKQ